MPNQIIQAQNRTNLDVPYIPLRYCLYGRKSTESDELQQLSIGAQINEMTALAKRENVEILKVFQESHSAKDSGQRPVFNEMITAIKDGKFDAILSWSADRLSRNAGDLGQIIDLMDQGVIRQIKTYGQTFTNSPNEKFLLMILGSTAKLENDSKGVNVKRGLRAKCEMGWRPGVPPLGYLHGVGEQKGQRSIHVDPKRAPIIKEMFEKIAYQNYSGRALLRWLHDVGFTTRSGKKIVLSSVYAVLKNNFYHGEFEYPVGSGVFYKGSYEPLITKELFDEVKLQLEVAPKSRPGTKEFDFAKMIKCGACGSGVCAEEKFKRLDDGSVRRHVYYHCTKYRNHFCKEAYIREETLTEELIKIIDQVNLDEIGTLQKMKQEMDRYQRFNNLILGSDQPEQAKKPDVDIKEYAKYLLQEGTRDEKREILNCLKTELYLKNQKIYLRK
ncbi:MAG: recombinase family protein [Candidatus Buchananbacteria bacterium]|nr:recombinase family protein [Candidatus Buchananbacteria bacterium]